MRLEFYKTLWGWRGAWREALREAAAAGFAGIEGPLPKEPEAVREARQSLAESGLSWIAEISTTGYAAPAPGASVAEHLSVLRREIGRALPLGPRFFTSMAGDDCWSLEESVEFFSRAEELAGELGVTLCCETHRARSLFHPRVASEIFSRVPTLLITADFSHWCNVCERLVLDDYPHFLQICAPRVRHIHARVGFDQGAQVPDPRLPRYQHAVEAHLRWWMAILEHHRARGAQSFTLTPEFGSDGYQQIEASTDLLYGNLWEMNTAIASLISEHWSRANRQN